MLGRAASVIVGALYPALVFVVIAVWDAAAVGFVSMAVGAARLAVWQLGPRAAQPRLDGLGVLLVCIGAMILASDAIIAARLYPVAVNLAALCYFAWTLIRPPSAIERIARLSDPELPNAAITYTRRVTVVWCAFFAGNAAVASYTALWSSIEVWALYNGFIAYLLIGLLFASEYFVRLRLRRRARLPVRVAQGAAGE